MDDLVETVNLGEQGTGMPGMVQISTAARHEEPNVNWYSERPGRGAPCLYVSISGEPEVRNLGLPTAVVEGMAFRVVTWVQNNEQALRAFWEQGIG